MSIVFELFHTLYPVLFMVAAAPLSFFFMSLEFTSRLWENTPLYISEHNALFLTQLLYAFFLTTGLVFIEKLVVKLAKVTRPINWFKLGLVQLGLFFIFFTWMSDAAYTIVDTIAPYMIALGAMGVVVTLLFIVNTLLNWGLSFAQWSEKIPLKVKKVLTIVAPIIYIYPFFVGLMIFIWFWYPDNPQASRFNVINAAIKNTCFIDQERENCPTTLEEISYIEPKQFEQMIDCCQVNYDYDAATNQYALVIRYSPTRAVVFDWRLIEEYGIDFKEYDVLLLGKDKLKDAPDWEGPWEFDDWDY